MEKSVVLEFINQNPVKYRSGLSRVKTEVFEKKCIISRDMRGNLIVSYAQDVFEFEWNDLMGKWV